MKIERIREIINNNVGNRIQIIYNEGRNKIYEYSGRLIEVYNNIFIVLDDENYSKRCFSYCDVLTNTVKVFFKM